MGFDLLKAGLASSILVPSKAEPMALILFVSNVSRAVALTTESFGSCADVSTPGRLKVHRSFWSIISSLSLLSKIAFASSVAAVVWHACTRNLSLNSCPGGGSSLRGCRGNGGRKKWIGPSQMRLEEHGHKEKIVCKREVSY